MKYRFTFLLMFILILSSCYSGYTLDDVIIILNHDIDEIDLTHEGFLYTIEILNCAHHNEKVRDAYISRLFNSSDTYIRQSILEGLRDYYPNDDIATKAIIKLYKTNTHDTLLADSTMLALVERTDPLLIDIFVEQMDCDINEYILETSAYGLLFFNNSIVNDALEKHKDKNQTALCVLAWKYGGQYLRDAEKITEWRADDYFSKPVLRYARVKWGEWTYTNSDNATIDSIDDSLEFHPEAYPLMHEDFLKRMPPEMPKYEKKEIIPEYVEGENLRNYARDVDQIERKEHKRFIEYTYVARNWYYDNKIYFVYDKNTMRYYLLKK